MRKWVFLPVLLLILIADMESQAWVAVTDYGDTGWRTFVYQAGPAGFSGTAGFVLSNVIDDAAYSELLLDNLSHGGGLKNRDFEMGYYSGFTVCGDECAEISTYVAAYSGKIYTSTRGEYFSHQCCLSTGVNTAAFKNARGQAGTTGSILETAISLPPGSKFTFDWAFLAGDQSPWQDFALFYLKDNHGQIVFSAGLAQIGPVPAGVPPAISLLLDLGL